MIGILGLGLAACDKKPPVSDVSSTTDASRQLVDDETREARLPSEAGEHAPSFARMAEGENYDAAVQMQAGECAECHTEIVEEWRESTHSLASIANPFYRAAFMDFAEKSGHDKLPFCGGCHDPALLFDGTIEEPLQPEAPETHVGITCNSCHGAIAATTDGNASYTLSTEPIPLPKDDDEESLAAHVKRLNPTALRTNTLCISCHRGFLTPESGHEVTISGIDEWAPWRGSAYNGNGTGRITDVEPANCVDCHMPEVDGHRSHRFPGGHTTLAAMTGSRAQIEAVGKMVKSAATLDIPAYGVGSPASGLSNSPSPEDLLWFDVVIFNRGSGHVFPGGARDLRDTWVEVEIRDSKGELLTSSGTVHEESGDDPGAYVLQAYMANIEGENVSDHSVHDFRAAVYNHTIDPLDARVARYVWKLPKNVDTPVKVTARLRHRRLTESFRKATCEFTKGEEDRPFALAAIKHKGGNLDPCQDQPVLTIDSFSASLDGTVPYNDARSLARRHYERALGLQKHLAENLEEALDAFDAAVKTIEDDERIHAKISLERGKVLARQGRTQDAMDAFKRAEAIVGEHPAIHYARGQAHQRVFQNEAAVEWFQKARALQKDARILRQLAIAAGSAGQAELALDAARSGLAIEPRDPHLLRSQMLALRKLNAPENEIQRARETFSRFKRDEKSAQIRDKCSANDLKCREGRLPLRIIEIE